MNPRVLRRLAFLGATGAAYAVVIRPWFLRWGATEKEVRGPWPGDDLIPEPISVATRAVTIQASPAEVWPWLVQIGQDRAGFYSYTWLENLVRANMRNANRIIPEFQQREVGDVVWLASEERYGGEGYAVVGELEPERALVLITHLPGQTGTDVCTPGSGTWAFLLEPLGRQTTRLIARSRTLRSSSWTGRLANLLFWEPVHFIMERKMLLGVKARVEAQRHRAATGATRPRSTTWPRFVAGPPSAS